MLMLLTQHSPLLDDPSEDDLPRFGTAASIMRMLKLPDGRIRVLVQGVCRARILEFTRTRPHLQARIEKATDQPHDPSSIEKEALMRSVKRLLERASSLGKNLPSEVMVIAGRSFPARVRYGQLGVHPVVQVLTGRNPDPVSENCTIRGRKKN